jgi:TRAP-type C4-dicarboxylate transport system permease small subunit
MNALLERTLGLLVAVLLFLMMLSTSVDVIGRYVFNAPLPGAVEINELLLGIIIFGTLPMITLNQDHITINLLDSILLPDQVDAVRKIFLTALSSVVFVLMTWQLWEQALTLATYGDRTSYLKVPLAPVAYFMFATSAITSLVVIALTLSHARSVWLSTKNGRDKE